MTAQTPAEEVRAVVEDYLDAFYDGDGAEMARLMRPDFDLIGIRGGRVDRVGAADFARALGERPSLRSAGCPREDDWVDLRVDAPTVAHAVVRNRAGDLRYTDVLTLLLDDDRWRIVSKVWSVEPAAAEA
ncbi:MAG: nuclear transport factor 2 family protein [Microbacterium sp.]